MDMDTNTSKSVNPGLLAMRKANEARKAAGAKSASSTSAERKTATVKARVQKLVPVGWTCTLVCRLADASEAQADVLVQAPGIRRAMRQARKDGLAAGWTVVRVAGAVREADAKLPVAAVEALKRA